MEVLTLINIFFGLIALGYWFISRKYQYWKNKKVPYVKPEFFYGNSRGISKTYSINEFYKNMYFKLKSKGPVVGVYLYTRPQALIMSPELIKQILVKDFNKFSNRGMYSNAKDDPLSANLAALEDDEWKSLRSKITPTFTSGKIKSMFGTIVDITDRLVKTIQKETKETGQLEIKDVLSRFTTDVIGSTAFGIECNSLEDRSTKFYEMGLKAFSNFNFFKRTILAINKNLGKMLHIKTTNKKVADFYLDVVGKTVKYRNENPNLQRNDFLNLLLKLKGSEALSFNQIAAQSVIFFQAGKSINCFGL